jgi:hypothetical protein
VTVVEFRAKIVTILVTYNTLLWVESFSKSSGKLPYTLQFFLFLKRSESGRYLAIVSACPKTLPLSQQQFHQLLTSRTLFLALTATLPLSTLPTPTPASSVLDTGQSLS